jgi:hypothetical protein
VSDDRPAAFGIQYREDEEITLSLLPEEKVIITLTEEEALALRDILARVSGCGSRAEVARRVFEILEGEFGYEVLDDDGLEGEIEAPDDSEVFGADGAWRAEVAVDPLGTVAGIWWCTCKPGALNTLSPGKCALCNKTIVNYVEVWRG